MKQTDPCWIGATGSWQCVAAFGNNAPWVRSDFTGFEVMLRDMATFSAPESTAERAQVFWG